MKPEIKRRIEQIQHGEVPEGYQRTKAGIVPIDWMERSFDNLFNFAKGLSIPRDKLTKEGINYLHYGDIHMREKTYLHVNSEENTMPKIQLDSAFFGFVALEDGDIVFADASEDNKGIGKAVVVYNQERRPVIAGLHTIVAKDKTKDLFRDYKRYFLHTKYIRMQFEFYATGVSIFGVTKDSISRMRIPLPSLIEQKKIAEILTTWDKAIELKEQLIAEKKQQKKWLMQNLLTGEIRLPGFSGEWEESIFGEVVKQVNNRVTPSTLAEDVICIELEHIVQEMGRLRGYTKAVFQKSTKNVFKKGDVLFGKLRPYLKKYYFATSFGVCSSEIWVLRGIPQFINNRFLFYFVQSTDFIKNCNASTGSKMPRADWSLVSNMAMLYPPLPEQIAIAEILSTADREIDLHEKQLEEFKKQKKALMQLLLTGIVRVTTKEVTPNA